MSASPENSRPPAPFLVAVFVISAAFLVLELLLSKLFSLMIWYHLAFVAIAVAMLGFAGSGLYLMYRDETKPLPDQFLAKAAAAFSASVLVVGVYTSLSPTLLPLLSSGNAFRGWVLTIGTMFGLAAVPFFFAGVFLSWSMVSHARTSAGWVYGANLLGSAFGCWAIIALLSVVGGAGTMLAVVAAGLLTAVLLGATGTLRTASLAGMAASLLAMVPFGLRGGNDFTLLHTLTKLEVPAEWHLDRKWDSSTAVDFFEMPQNEFGFWGADKRDFEGTWPRKIGIYIDSYAFTSIINAEDEAKDGRFYERLPVSLPLVEKQPSAPKVMVIGSGGGNDVRSALHFGASKVTAVEINPLIVNELKNEFKDWSGDLYRNPKVNVVVSEGRSYAQRDPEKYDVIILSGVDTVTGTQAGAYSFSENFLYTQEAVETFYDSLAPGGYLYFMRFIHPGQDRELVRLTGVARAVLERRGIDTAKQMFLFDTHDWVYGGMILKKGEFEAGEEEALRAHAEQLGYTVVKSPRHPATRPEFEQILSAPDLDAFVASYPYVIHPVTDDSPFFFFFSRWTKLFSPDYAGSSADGALYWQGPRMLVLGLVVVLGLCIPFTIQPARRLARAGVRLSEHRGMLVYFCCLGLAYLWVEVALMNKLILLLGHPLYALAVVLAVMLVSSGLGSFASERLKPFDRRVALGLFAVLAVTLVVVQLALHPVTMAFLSSPMPVRIAVACALIFPIAFLMGIPFPLGLSVIERVAPKAVSWGWALNGYFSTVASVTSVLLAIELGFDWVYRAGIASYLVALAVVWVTLGRKAAAVPDDQAVAAK